MTSVIIVLLLLTLAVVGLLLVAVSGRRDVMETVNKYYQDCQPVSALLVTQPDEQVPALEVALDVA